MGGIIFFGILIIWFVISLKLARILFNKLNPKRGRRFVLIVLSLLVFVAPVTDEIIGGFQFRALCNAPDNLVYDPEKLRDKTVQLRRTEDLWIARFVPIREQTWDWVVVDTGDSSLLYKEYYAKGGWLSRLTNFLQEAPPYTFVGHCWPKEAPKIFKELHITKQVNGYYGE